MYIDLSDKRMLRLTVFEILCNNNDRGMTRQEIIGTSRVLLVAGSETTATLLSGATYLLLQHPTTLRRVQDEIRKAFKSADDITLRSVSQPNRLPYLEAVLQESFRCYPSIPATLPRITGAAGAMIDGAYVPANVGLLRIANVVLTLTLSGLRRGSPVVNVS